MKPGKYAIKRLRQAGRLKGKEIQVLKKHIRREHKILDLCCGPGTHLSRLHPEYDVTGVDISEDMVRIARNNNAKAHLADARKLPFRDGTFHVVLLLGYSLGSMLDKKHRNETLSEASRVLKKGGKLILSLKNKAPDPQSASFWEQWEKKNRNEAVAYYEISGLIHPYTIDEAEDEIRNARLIPRLETRESWPDIIFTCRKMA